MTTLMTIVSVIVGIPILCAMAYFAWMSSVMISQRNYLRKLTGAYYDFDIDEELKEMGMTRQQALARYQSKVFDKSKVRYFDGDNT